MAFIKKKIGKLGKLKKKCKIAKSQNCEVFHTCGTKTGRIEYKKHDLQIEANKRLVLCGMHCECGRKISFKMNSMSSLLMMCGLQIMLVICGCACFRPACVKHFAILTLRNFALFFQFS